MDKFNEPQSFTEYVANLGNEVFHSELQNLEKRSNIILNGEASHILRKVIPLKERREHGLFFTGVKISNKLAGSVRDELREGRKICDPTCGSGDLLIACARYLPIKENLNLTLELWADLVKGYDVRDDFIELTKLRLLLLAAIRTKQINTLQNINRFETLFPNINKSDLLSNTNLFQEDEIIVFNPPYGYTSVRENIFWASGTVQKAAIFFEKILDQTNAKNKILAILPDVLRSGSRYRSWRNHVASFGKKFYINILGKFDKFTDVDVFLLQFNLSSNKKHGWEVKHPSINHKKKVADLFDISVGSVVPHRNIGIGSWKNFLTSSESISWGNVSHFRKIRYNGKCVKPPFVVIKRTSSPNDRFRAVGTIVRGKEPVAIENHLIIAKPLIESIQICEELLINLKNDKTNKWLNNRIRCRHLTTESIKSLPLWDK